MNGLNGMPKKVEKILENYELRFRTVWMRHQLQNIYPELLNKAKPFGSNEKSPGSNRN